MLMKLGLEDNMHVVSHPQGEGSTQDSLMSVVEKEWQESRVYKNLQFY